MQSARVPKPSAQKKRETAIVQFVQKHKAHEREMRMAMQAFCAGIPSELLTLKASSSLLGKYTAASRPPLAARSPFRLPIIVLALDSALL